MIDDGYSGARLNRPGLDRLRDAARRAAFERVLLTGPDRLARNYVHQMLIVEELATIGCELEFLERPMSSDPHDQLLLQIRGAVAEYERTLIADRMRRGRQAKLRSGQLLPWTRGPYGYLLDMEHPRDANLIRVDRVKAEVVKQIFDWYSDVSTPVSLYSIARRLTEAGIPTPTGNSRWNVASIRSMLRSPVYAGMAYSGRSQPVAARRRRSALKPVGSGQSQAKTSSEEWITIPVPAIISQETFDLVQHRLNQNKQASARNNTTHQYLLRGLVNCGQCRLVCTGRALHGRYIYYVCRGRTDSLRAIKDRCISRYTPVHQLDDLVWNDLCRMLSDPILITQELERAQAGEWLPQALHARRQTIGETLAQVERQQARLLEVYLAEIIERDEFERKRQELTRTHQGFTQQLRQLETQAQKQVETAGIAKGVETFCHRIQPTLETLTFAQRRQLVELLIDCVIVDNGKVEIRYVFPITPNGEQTRFCHLRLNHLNAKTAAIGGFSP